MLKSIRVIKFVRSAYNNYVNSVLAGAEQKVVDANQAVRTAQAEQQDIFDALFQTSYKK